MSPPKRRPAPCPPNGPDGWPLFPRGRKKVLVSGSRSFTDYKLLKDRLEYYTFELYDFAIITGGCPKGADALAAKFAFQERYLYLPIEADWDKHGKKAGPIRNQEIVNFCSVAVFFWDGRSPGTADCLDRMKRTGKPYRVVRF